MRKPDLGEMPIKDAAKLAAGNWERFNCFVWWKAKDLDNSSDWFIFYSHHRDSGLLDQSNAVQIGKALAPFMEGDDPDVVAEDHHHWAVGWIRGWSIRVYKNNKITKAFRVIHGLMKELSDYPILNESHYSEMELEATYENIPLAAWRIKDEYELPENWVDQVDRWLSDNNCSALENVDDHGGYPSEDDLREAFAALNYKQLDLAG